MKKLLLGSISALLALPVLAAIEAGSMAPMFEARASFDGKEFDFSLHNALEDGPVVVYFYPSAFTQGCNMQGACLAKGGRSSTATARARCSQRHTAYGRGHWRRSADDGLASGCTTAPEFRYRQRRTASQLDIRARLGAHL